MYNLSYKLRADKSSMALLSNNLFSYILQLDLTKKKDLYKVTTLCMSVYKNRITQRRLCKAFLDTIKFLLINKAQIEYLDLNQLIDQKM